MKSIFDLRFEWLDFAHTAYISSKLLFLPLARLPAATIMGLDDAISDSKIDEKILQLCLEARILDSKLCYTGYSVAFHAVLPFVTVEVMGCSPFFVNSQGENNIPERQMKDIRCKLRGRLLKIFRGPIKEKKIEQVHRMVDQGLISEEMGREKLRKFGVGNTTAAVVSVLTVVKKRARAATTSS